MRCWRCSTASDATSRGPLSATPAAERSKKLDAIRGFAVLGILLVNVLLFYGPQGWSLSVGEPLSPTGRLAEFLITWLGAGKFVSTLSFLFGVGLAMQATLATRRGRPARPFLARRLVVLAGFGLLHAIFIWSGDILLLYALLGFPLLLFLTARPAILLGAATALFFVSFASFVLFVFFASPDLFRWFQEIATSSQRAYTSGSYAQMVGQRLRDMTYWYGPGLLLSAVPNVFAMMLLGIAAVRAGWLPYARDQRTVFRRLATIALPIGLAMSLLAALTSTFDLPELFLPGAAAYVLGPPVLAAGYMATIIVLSERLQGITHRLAAVGRMALTNYLTQSIMMTSVFYGLGLYGRVGLLPALGLCAGIVTSQLLLSPLWLRRFSHGPAEWLWRRLTYGKRGASPELRTGSSIT